MILRASLVAALLLGTAAAQEEWTPRTTELVHAPAPLDGFLDLRAIFHAHSKHSHDSKMEPAKIVEIANALAIDAFFMTDHPSAKSLSDGLRGRHGRTLFFAGAETHGLLALDIREEVPGKGAIENVHSQGGIALVAHPEDWKDWKAPFAGMEIVNLHHMTLKSGPLGSAIQKAGDKKGLEKVAAVLEALDKDPSAKRLLAAIDRMNKEPEGVLLSLIERPASYLERWDELGRTRRVPGVAGNDSHQNTKLADIQVDAYERTLRVANTHLLARTNDEAGIKEALLAGRIYVAFEVWGDTHGFAFFGPGGLVMGEERRFEEPLELVALAPPGGTIRLFKDGKLVAEEKGERLAHVAREGGVYRIEVVVERRGREVPWILSNPIYLRDAD